ncbi:MAG TPA: 16S rRNA (cytidine(1402)-2'-O)-methyltransferase [Pyrinomonadaceae bacterium]|jgi:16S rRNA (cytidine1402-2'-O)-methyltransferase|nr:16S rRNA (cytidine(1402)-2'-O)-methyltransferase [Pyrinomonadaceae bacterium]
MTGTLYLVATPIGNLADITHRAIQVLKDVDLIACEDTRHTNKLLNHYAITTKTISYHEHNEQQRAAQLIEQLKEGSDIAVVSDAGTPSISDPGFRLVRAAIENEIAVVPVPGPSALIAALIAAGLPTDEFFFAGFLPSRPNARRARLSELQSVPGTLIFYEAPHRLVATLKDALEVLGEREAVVARELTKLHEEIRRGRLSELATDYADKKNDIRGEIVVLIDRTVIGVTAKHETSIATLVDQFEQQGLDHRAALKKAARELGLSRAEAYRQLIVLKNPR